MAPRGPTYRGREMLFSVKEVWQMRACDPEGPASPGHRLSRGRWADAQRAGAGHAAVQVRALGPSPGQIWEGGAGPLKKSLVNAGSDRNAV